MALLSRAVPSVEAHYCSVGSDAGRNFGGERIIKKTSNVIAGNGRILSVHNYCVVI